MADTSARMLRLLSLLQTRREWSGGELAERLGVSPRTVRRDIERLRDLGYPVDAERGTAGYRLAAGKAMPPLLLDDEEAVAAVISLRTAAASVVGVGEAALRALAKLEQVLPARLRQSVSALQTATVRAGEEPGPQVAAGTLTLVADACRRRERLRFDYAAHGGERTRRDVEPHKLVSWGKRWYLVAWDTAAGDWRLFRVDRMEPKTPVGPGFAERTPPFDDVGAYVDDRLSSQAWAYRAVVRLEEPASAVVDRIWPGMGVLEPAGEGACLLRVGAETPWDLAWMVTSVNADFRVVEGPPELDGVLRGFGERCLGAIRGDGESTG
ncbi:helix-turn-helix transcriptional regulator [Salininema proteolyticum]|uniref:Helix-turn-helix transcriptional regulator n=1 Tax=Salininema proteolyticum TaxID=1607685 RepID=A0ABV8U1N9_9ACTN